MISCPLGSNPVSVSRCYALGVLRRPQRALPGPRAAAPHRVQVAALPQDNVPAAAAEWARKFKVPRRRRRPEAAHAAAAVAAGRGLCAGIVLAPDFNFSHWRSDSADFCWTSVKVLLNNRFLMISSPFLPHEK